MATPTLSCDPISAEVRGRLRLWRRRAREVAWRLTDRVYQRTQDRDIVHMVKRSSLQGRRRAFAKLARSFADASLEGVRLEGDYPLAVWAYLRPRSSVSIEPYEDDPGSLQDCVTASYLLAGLFPGKDGKDRVGKADGLWSIEVTEHALGRLLQRAPGCNIDAVLLAAHRAALRTAEADVPPCEADAPPPGFLLPAGPGAFVCQLRAGPDISLGGAPMVRMRARTWLHADQLRDDQRPIAIDGERGERLGDWLLMPPPLRLLVVGDGGRIYPARWAPGLPESLAQAQGRAR
jgi:hypothetical protein